MKLLFSIIVFFSLLSPLHAAIETHDFKDAQTEKDYKALIDELRCLVCQNQNLSGSDAPLAKDLRDQAYNMLQQGKSRDEVIEYMVNRYGNFVLYRPPLESNTLILWIGPFALLLIVLVVVMLRIKRTRSVEAPEKQGLENAKHLLEDDANTMAETADNTPDSTGEVK